MKRILTTTFLVLFTLLIYGQVSISTDNSTPDPSAMLDVKSSGKGLLPPRMTQAELAQIASPANGLIIYCTDCGVDGTGAFYGYQFGNWQILLTCQPPSAPAAGVHVAGNDQIIWKWIAVPGVSGYRWSASNTFASALNIGTALSFTETGLACNMPYTRYVWAFNNCGTSFPVTLAQSTTSTLPATPLAGVHTATSSQITWNWNAVTGAAGYKWNTVNDYNTASDLGSATTKTETQLQCSTPYTRFVWAYSVCGNSVPAVLTMATGMNPPAGISITVSANQVCDGTNVTFSSAVVNGGATPGFQWMNNGNAVSGATSGSFTYAPANNDVITCVLTSGVPCTPNSPVTSNAISMTVNSPPVPPSEATHSSQMTQITWKWHSVPLASGYRWSSTNNYQAATDVGTDTVKTETGLTCDSNYSRYIWAYNQCGPSEVTIISHSTSPCNTPGEPCPGMPTVAYEGKTYHTLQIGTQCWFRENLNAGTRINGINSQGNNGILEKYCYSDSEDSCSIYGGLYQWNEAMQYATLPGSQGACPSGWHIPTDGEWTTLTTFLGTPDSTGGKLKETGTRHWVSPNTAASNISGFTALGGGYRRSDNGTFSSVRFGAHFYTSTDTNTTVVWKRYLGYNIAAIQRNANLKTNGFAIRCLRNSPVSYPGSPVTSPTPLFRKQDTE